MYKGQIKYLKNGWGFISVDGEPKDVFFHSRELENGNFDDLEIGQNVEIEKIEENPKGLQGKNIKVI